MKESIWTHRTNTVILQFYEELGIDLIPNGPLISIPNPLE